MQNSSIDPFFFRFILIYLLQKTFIKIDSDTVGMVVVDFPVYYLFVKGWVEGFKFFGISFVCIDAIYKV